jgi:hypothetical protein
MGPQPKGGHIGSPETREKMNYLHDRSLVSGLRLSWADS